MTMMKGFVVEVMYSFDCESDGGVAFEKQEDALAYFERMLTEVPNDNEFGQVDYMSFYKAEGDVDKVDELGWSNYVENVETMEWNEEEWNAALK